MNYKAYLMNLDQATHRLEYMKKQLDPTGVQYERWPSVDGTKINITYYNTTYSGQYLQDQKIRTPKKTEVKIHCNNNLSTEFYIYSKIFGFVPGELGRYCTDISIWQDAMNNGYKTIVVFEDDFKIKRINKFKSELELFIGELPANYDVAYFGFDGGPVEHVPGTKCVKALKKNFGAWGAPAMIISEKGIKKLLNAGSYDSPIDLFYLDHNYNKLPMANGEYLEVYGSCYGNELMRGVLQSEMIRY